MPTSVKTCHSDYTVSKKSNGYCIKPRILNDRVRKKDNTSIVESFNLCRKLPTDAVLTSKVEEHLNALKPSQYLTDLIDYYREKTDSLLTDHENVQNKLEQISNFIRDNSLMQKDVEAKNHEILRLQRSLSDFQDSLYRERDQVLRLIAENDRLRIREEEDRDKIHHLLNLTDLGPLEVTYFLRNRCVESKNSRTQDFPDGAENSDTREKNPASTAVIEQVIPRQGYTELLNSNQTHFINTKTLSNISNKNQNNLCSNIEKDSLNRQLESAKKTISSLRCQLESQIQKSENQMRDIIEVRDERQNSLETITNQMQEIQRSFQIKLDQAHQLLHDCTQEFVSQRQQFKQAERVWISERTKLVQQLENERKSIIQTIGLRSRFVGTDVHSRELVKNEKLDSDQMLFPRNAITKGGKHKLTDVLKELRGEREKHYEQTIENLKSQLNQQKSLVEMYRNQIIDLEQALSDKRQQLDQNQESINEQTTRMQQRVELSNKRLRDLEKRRQLEIQGYQTNINSLRQKSLDLEQQLTKLMKNMISGVSKDQSFVPENVELVMLGNIKDMSAKTSKLSNELKSLKAKIYSIENDLRRV